MKKIVYFIIGLIIIFLLSNYSLFLSNYYIKEGNKFYELGDFSGALDYYNKSLNNISLHNIGNVNYYLGEDLNDEEKINYYNKSLEAFSGALNIKFDDDTKFNYDYVADLLKDLENSQDEQNQEENQEQQDSGENSEEQELSNTGEEEQNQEKSEQESSNGEGEEDSDETEKSSSSNNNENNGEGEENSVTQMSNGEYQQVKKYIESLEEQEGEYQDFFNKTSDNTDPFESMFDSMFNNGGEKDW